MSRTPSTSPAPDPDGVLTVPEISEILTGEIRGRPAGDRLPTEQELMERFDVGRTVIRRVLDNLESRLLIKRVQGSGTFVNGRVDYLVSDTAVMSLQMTARSAGARGEMRVVAVDRVPVSKRQARLFGVEAGRPYLRFTRVGYLNDEDSVRTQDWVIPGACQDMDAAIGVFRSVSDSIRAYGFSPKRSRSIVTVEDMPRQVRQDLQVEHPSLGSHLESVVVDAVTKEPLIVSDTWFRLDSVRLIFDYS